MEDPREDSEKMSFAEQIQHQAHATTGHETWADINHGADATRKAMAVLAIVGAGLFIAGMALTSRKTETPHITTPPAKAQPHR